METDNQPAGRVSCLKKKTRRNQLRQRLWCVDTWEEGSNLNNTGFPAAAADSLCRQLKTGVTLLGNHMWWSVS